MPESRGRDKAAYTPPPRRAKDIGPNPAWFLPLMLGLMIVGLVWVVTFYVTQSEYPWPGIGYWNLAVGFSLMIAGFLMTTRWR